jgi:hypothetical protein
MKYKRFKLLLTAFMIAASSSVLAEFTSSSTVNMFYYSFDEPLTVPFGVSPDRFVCGGNCPYTSTDVARLGAGSLKSYINRLTSDDMYRSEATHQFKMDVNNGVNTQDYWLAFSVYYPSPRPVMDFPVYEIVYQVHSSPPPPETWETYSNYNPTFVVQLEPNSDTSGNFLIMIVASNDPYPQLPDNRPPVVHTKRFPYQTDTWHDFVVHTRQDSVNGFTKVWINGVLVVDYVGPNYLRGHGDSYFKAGLYTGWRVRDSGDAVEDRTGYIDEERLAWGSGVSYATVAPGGEAPPPPPPPPVEVFPAMTNLRVTPP